MKSLFIAVMLASATAIAQPRPGQPDPAATYSIPVEPTIDSIVGPADAKVTLVLATEYACPYCEKVHEPIAELAKKYGKDLRVVERQFIVHPQVATAYAAAACAAMRQGKFDDMDTYLWEMFHQRKFDDASCLADAKTCTNLADAVVKIKLDAARFARDLTTCQTKIADAQTAMTTAFHVQAIPTMWINGRFLQGAQPAEAIAKVIDEELAKPKTRYDDIVKRGIKSIAPAPPSPTPTPPVGGGGSGAPVMRPPPMRPQPDAAKTYAIGVFPEIDGIVGPADAKVTLVVGSDYACPYCDKVRPTLDELAKKYGKDLRIVHRQFIVHPTTATASALAACAANRQRRFVEMDAALWAHFANHELDAGECWTDPKGCAFVDASVDQLKLDKRRFARDMAACRAPIAAAQLTWTALGAGAIPTTWINGRFLEGALPIDRFERIIDEELAKATERIGKGATAATYYHDWVEAKGATSL